MAYSRSFLLKQILQYITAEYGIVEYETCYYLNSDTMEYKMMVHYDQLIPVKEYINSCMLNR